jgi:hypothetical protein
MFKDSIMKPTKLCLKGGLEVERGNGKEYNRRGELVQGIIYTHMELL